MSESPEDFILISIQLEQVQFQGHFTDISF